jgi:hypothetical protein
MQLPLLLLLLPLLLLLLLQAAHGQVIDGETYRAAEPDLLRNAADELITTWNRCAGVGRQHVIAAQQARTYCWSTEDHARTQGMHKALKLSMECQEGCGWQSQ